MQIPTQYVEINYKNSVYRFAYKIRRSHANKATLIFLSGVGCTKECFDDAFNADDLSKYPILSFDFLGFGESDKPSNFPYTLEDHAAVTKLLIQALHLNKIILIGHSMGAGVGLLLAQELPGITNFINVEGALVSEDISGAARSVIAQSEEAFVSSGFDTFKQSLIALGRKDLSVWASWLEVADATALYRSMRSMATWPDSPRLLQYFNDLPKKSYIYGDERNKDYLLPRLTDTTVYRMDNCGHFMMIDNPTAFYKAIGSITELM